MKEYSVNLGGHTWKCREPNCFVCRFCDDIFYDSSGPYMGHCDKNPDFYKKLENGEDYDACELFEPLSENKEKEEMTLAEAIEEINAMIERCAYDRDIEALTMAKEALETMKNIKEADDIVRVVDILIRHLSEVEL